MPSIEQTLEIANSNLTTLQNTFKTEEFSVPIGFTDHDVNWIYGK